MIRNRKISAAKFVLRKFIFAGLMWLAATSTMTVEPALAQSFPAWTYGYVPTQAEWIGLWASKQDYLGAAPILSTGGTFTGPVSTANSTTGNAPFNLQCTGTAPTSPNNGDMWCVGGLVYAQVNGSTVPLGASSGSVTSVALSLPSALFAISGSPITSNGTLTATLQVQAVNTVWAGPSSGSSAAPTFRALTSTDMPATAVVAGTGLTGGNVNYGGTIAIDSANSTNYYAGTANKVVTTGIIYPAEVAVTYGTTTTFDMTTFINASVTLTGNITTMTVTNPIAGKAGTIRFIHSGTVTIAFNSIFKFSGGATPTPTTGSATDVMNYNCITTSFCQAIFANDVK